jgi:hypothetical protein
MDLASRLTLLSKYVINSKTNSSGTGDQTLCVTGIVFPSIGATQGVTNVQCWLTWDGGNWNATRCM